MRRQKTTSPRRKPSEAKNQVAPSRENSGLKNNSLTTCSPDPQPWERLSCQEKRKEQVWKYSGGKEKMPEFNVTASYITSTAGNGTRLWTIFFGFCNLDSEGLCFLRGKKRKRSDKCLLNEWPMHILLNSSEENKNIQATNSLSLLISYWLN